MVDTIDGIQTVADFEQSIHAGTSARNIRLQQTLTGVIGESLAAGLLLSPETPVTPDLLINTLTSPTDSE